MPSTNILVVFDLVSTLTDAGPRYARAFVESCQNFDIKPPIEDAILPLLGEKNLHEITTHFAGNLDPAHKRDFMEDCNRTCDAMLTRPGWREKLFPHVRGAVETLRVQDATLGIFTGSREDAMNAQLAHHGLDTLFDPRYRRGKDNLRDAGKSIDALKTEHLAGLATQFRQDTGRSNAPVLVVGDSPSDARAAQALGLNFAGFFTSQAKKDRLEAAGITLFFNDYRDLPALTQRFVPTPSFPATHLRKS